MEYSVHEDIQHISDAFQPFVEKIVSWTTTDQNVVLAVVLGSQAHKNAKVDQWSDIDLAIVVQDQTPFDSAGHWIKRFTDYSFLYEESAGVGDGVTWHIILPDSRLIDLSIFCLADIRAWMDERTSVKLRNRGFFKTNLLVLEDKINLLHQIISQDDIQNMLLQEEHAPDLDTIYRHINCFWYHVLRSIKHLNRDDLWRAFMSCNYEIKRCLLQLIEWDTKLKSNWSYDTRYEGRMIADWADDDIVRSLPQVFSHYNKIALTQSLLATIELFERVSHNLLMSLYGLSYPQANLQISCLAKDQLNRLLDE